MFCKMKKLKNIVLLLVFVATCQDGSLFAQSLEQTVIGAGGDFDTPVADFTISATVGEAITITVNAGSPTIFLTQGFHQPIVNDNIEVQPTIKNETCIGAGNGVISVSVLNSAGPFTYAWTPNTQDTSSTAVNLTSGVYYVTVTDIINGNMATDTIVVGSEANEICGLIIYSGITPNEDGKNDTWIIDRILDFPSNKVFIFNRWGEEVWRGMDYDNNLVLWRGQDKANRDLPDGTYFYYIKTEPREYKGWVELTR
jgi:gliding motility-associated-like protein